MDDRDVEKRLKAIFDAQNEDRSAELPKKKGLTVSDRRIKAYATEMKEAAELPKKNTTIPGSLTVLVLGEDQYTKFSYELFKQYGHAVQLVVFPLSDASFIVIADRSNTFERNQKISGTDLLYFMVHQTKKVKEKK